MFPPRTEEREDVFTFSRRRTSCFFSPPPKYGGSEFVLDERMAREASWIGVGSTLLQGRLTKASCMLFT